MRRLASDELPTSRAFFDDGGAMTRRIRREADRRRISEQRQTAGA